jgi:hypothetical protein
MTITEFLTARLDEDWANVHGQGEISCDDLEAACKCATDETPRRIDCPARWAGDIAAKRAIVDFMRSEDAAGSGLTDAEGIARSLRAIAVLRHLASPYADHPDYQQEWA